MQVLAANAAYAKSFGEKSIEVKSATKVGKASKQG
jgi:hypothetical protein